MDEKQRKMYQEFEDDARKQAVFLRRTLNTVYNTDKMTNGEMDGYFAFRASLAQELKNLEMLGY